MIAIDLSQTLYASILAYDNIHPDKININDFRYICLNTIHNILIKFKYTYGRNIVIACDNEYNWRKDIFEYYKYNRKKNRDSSQFDWKEIYNKFNTFKNDLKENFQQYKVLDIKGAEADDIIYCCAKYCYKINEPLMIISGDKDLVQLQIYKNVKQYDSIRKKYKEIEDPIKFLQYQIFKGDNSDGIPNVLSPLNSYYIGQRCKPMFESKIDKWLDDPIFNFNLKQILGEEIYNRYEINKKLIDLSSIPEELYNVILEELKKDWNERDSNKLLNYFCENRLGNLLQNLQDF